VTASLNFLFLASSSKNNGEELTVLGQYWNVSIGLDHNPIKHKLEDRVDCFILSIGGII